MHASAQDGDRVAGDGDGITVYARPDGGRYALDRLGGGYEVCFGEGVCGPARFDSRHLADGRWPGSRSYATAPAFPVRGAGDVEPPEWGGSPPAESDRDDREWYVDFESQDE